MTKYEIRYASKFTKEFKKLTPELRDKTKDILNRLANGETLEAKYKDHSLKRLS